jgi:hypothetical protein
MLEERHSASRKAELWRFEQKPAAHLMRAWIPVRVKKTRQNWNLALWLIQSEAKKR